MLLSPCRFSVEPTVGWSAIVLVDIHDPPDCIRFIHYIPYSIRVHCACCMPIQNMLIGAVRAQMYN
jgi:hypothetical protein